MNSIESVKQQILDLVSQYYDLAHKGCDEFTPGDRITYAGRFFDQQELLNLTDASLDFWLTSGKWTEKFESMLASYLGIDHCLLVSSGSSANLLAFACLTSYLLEDRRICPGDEVITVAAGFPTTTAPILQLGAIPVFVDVAFPSCNIDTTKLSSAVSNKTKAVFLAHTLGNPFNVDIVKAFCKTNNLWLIEDNCDALGAEYNGAKTGTLGDIGTSSFYPPHHITTGEGGAVYTKDPLLAKILQSMRDWGRDCSCPSGQDNVCGKRFSGQYGSLPVGYDHKYVYSHFGFNLKATDLQASIGCAQLEKLADFVAARRRNWQWLRDKLAEFSNVFILPEAEENSTPSWFGFLLTVKENAPFTRNDIVQHMESKNIQTRMLFAGNIIRHPCFTPLEEGRDYIVSGKLTNTDRVMNCSFWFGVYPGINAGMNAYIFDTIKSYVQSFRKASK